MSDYQRYTATPLRDVLSLAQEILTTRGGLKRTNESAHGLTFAGPEGVVELQAHRHGFQTDVVVRTDPGTGRTAVEQLERLGLRPVRFESAATPEDAALILADAADAAIIVGVGMHATLEDFLDRRRSGLASTFLTRLKVGPRLVDASAVPLLYAGRVRPRHLFLVMVSGLVALAAAVGVTPVGQEWAEALVDSSLADTLRGLLP